MLRWVIIAMGLLFFGASARAIPARGVPIVVTQADGSKITIVVHGDEYSGWTSTVEGYQIVQKEGIYYYYEPQSSRSGGSLRASDPAARSASEVWGLTGRFRGQIDAGASDNTRRMSYPLLEQLSASKATTNPNPVTGPTRSLVLLVQFSDVSFLPAHTQNTFFNLLNTGPTSARQYFSDNSQGIYNPTFDVKGPYTLPQPMAYYGAKTDSGHDKDPQQMVIDACNIAAKQGVNFKQYDQNNDGRVDNVYIIYAGVNQAEGGGDNTIWPHRWTLQNKPNTSLNGAQVWDYACGSELSFNTSTSKQTLAGIGTFCHEFGHVLGLPDFYDTDGATNGESVGLYHFSIMGTGNYNNQGHTPPHYTALERWLLGWGTLNELNINQQVTLAPIEVLSEGWRIAAVEPDEFYVVEARGSRSWDAYLGSTGLLIYHIDRSNSTVGGISARERWRLNSINNYALHPCVRLLESSGNKAYALIQPQSYAAIQSGADKVFYPGSGRVSQFTGQSAGGVDWRNNAVAVELVSIVNDRGTVSFATRASQGTGSPLSFRATQRSVVVSISPELYNKVPEGSTFLFTAKADNKMELRQEIKDTPHSITVLGLSPNTEYTGTLWAFRSSSESQELGKAKFTTPSLSAPFAALTGLKSKLPVGTIVELGVTNLPEPATKLHFEINNVGLEGTSHTFTAKGLHTVRCTITYGAQDRETIERTVTIE